MSPTTTTTRPACLNPPRLPAICPVSVTRFRAPNGDSLAVVRDRSGLLVETIDTTDERAALDARYPWTSSYALYHYRPAELTPYWPDLVDVPLAELRRMAKVAPRAETAKLRERADRCQRFAAVVQALRDVRMHGTGIPDPGMDDEPRTAIIYHRSGVDGGADDVSRYLARAMVELERAGMVRKVGPVKPPASLAKLNADAYTRQLKVYLYDLRTFGRYLATDATPDI